MGYLNDLIDAHVVDYGIIDYEQTYQAMQTFQQKRIATTPDEIWVVQHNPVFTLGRNGKQEHIINAGSIPVVMTDRGGQVTYHGPGQLVIYTLIDLKRNQLGVKQWVNHIENSIIQLLNNYNIDARNNPKAPGVYVDNSKIAALGLRVSKGRCYHGLSVNVAMDLEPFQRINPCGYKGLKVTQCQDLGVTASISEISQCLVGKISSLKNRQ